MSDEADGAPSEGADRQSEGGACEGGGWRASRSCTVVRSLGLALLTVSVGSLAVAVAPIALTVDLPVVEVVDPGSLRAVTRGIVVGLVLTGNGELADRVVGAGRALGAAARRRRSA